MTRIDTVRNQVHATHLLLEKALANLEDLHHLAYDRAAAKDAERVSGGTKDWALDTHGSQTARELLKRGMRLADGSCANLAGWAHEVLSFLADGEQQARRTPQTVTVSEFVEALEAQERRNQRGEGTWANHPQPGGLLLAENKRLRKRIAQLERQLPQAKREAG